MALPNESDDETELNDDELYQEHRPAYHDSPSVELDGRSEDDPSNTQAPASALDISRGPTPSQHAQVEANMGKRMREEEDNGVRKRIRKITGSDDERV
ncbi:hypothetical protein NPX13_g10845 [Xylaria arbuscula]|uniref:Uncharacterized protein n=1 Tax=Xylaria arbuscula TaxID=114810 RepID=A0A9W8N3X6_9PEZI|nr:hypothetical protein NPX13_g10845 [Xylaria arbuscula]